MRVESNSSALRVYAFGMGERTTKSMAIVFDRQMRGACVLGEAGAADVAIIDLDAPDAWAEVGRQRERYPGRPIVLLAFDDAAARLLDGIVIAKPINVNHLVKVLSEIGSKLATGKLDGGALTAGDTCLAAAAAEAVDPSVRFPGQSIPVATRPPAAPVLAAPIETAEELPRTRRADIGMARAPTAETDLAVAARHSHVRNYYIGTDPDIDLDEPEQRAKVFYDPRQFLQGFVQGAAKLGIENASVVVLSSKAFGKIEVYPSVRKVRASASTAALYAAARIPLGERDVSIDLAPNLPLTPVGEEGIMALDGLIWQLALWASRGRLPAGIAPQGAVVLKHWPNLPRLLCPPHATRIAGLWSRRATPLNLTAMTLGIPQRYVFAFYSACSALDLIIPDRRVVPRPPVQEAPPEPETRNLFRMLLDKLKRNLDDATA